MSILVHEFRSGQYSYWLLSAGGLGETQLQLPTNEPTNGAFLPEGVGRFRPQSCGTSFHWQKVAMTRTEWTGEEGDYIWGFITYMEVNCKQIWTKRMKGDKEPIQSVYGLLNIQI